MKCYFCGNLQKHAEHHESCIIGPDLDLNDALLLLAAVRDVLYEHKILIPAIDDELSKYRHPDDLIHIQRLNSCGDNYWKLDG